MKQRIIFLFVCFTMAQSILAQNNFEKDIEAAKAGNKLAQYNVGYYYYNGEGVKQDYTKAVYWYRKAAEQNENESQFMLGVCYFNGRGIKQDYEKAAFWYRKAAEQENAKAQTNLGYCYEKGLGVTQSISLAVSWYKKAAEHGEPNAQQNLGICYEEGVGLEQDDTKAAYYIRKAAEQGLASAQDRLGSYYLIARGVSQDLTLATEWIRKAAIKGYALAQYRLGFCYKNGYGIEKDYSKAINWFLKAAEQGEENAQFELGLMYNNGDGVNQDYTKAINWYKKAAEQGNEGAQNNLGLMYLTGQGVTQNTTLAIEWFQKAGNQGNIGAQENLARLFLFGDGVNKDLKKAEMWIKKAIETEGNSPYPYSLAALLFAQREKNYSKALLFSDKAISLINDYDSESQAEFYGHRGLIYIWQGDMDNAEKTYTTCLELDANYLESGDEFSKMMKAYHSIDVDTNIFTTTSNNKNTFAVVIGNENYKNVEDVPFAKNDAAIICKYIEKTLGVPSGQIKHIENGTYNDIRIAINWIIQAMKVCRGKGKAIIYYAGHGIPNETDLSSYLLPIDGIGNDPGSAFSLKELYEKLSNIDTQSTTIFLDACFSGSKREEGMLSASRGVALKVKQNTPQGNVIVFSAAQGDETAYPYKEKRHGMFTYYLLKKLQDTKGEVSLGELCEYLTNEVGRESFIKNNKIQTPTVSVASSLQNSWKSLKLK